MPADLFPSDNGSIKGSPGAVTEPSAAHLRNRFGASKMGKVSIGGAPANLTYQTPDDYSRFQGEQQKAFWKWLEPTARPASR